MKFGIAFALLALALNVQAQTWTWLAGMGTEGATTSVAGALGVEAPGNMPSGRQSFAAFYDETLDSTFVFGGRPSEFTTKPDSFLNDMWRFNHTSKMWAQLAAVTKAGGGTCTATPSTESPTNWPGATSNMAYYYDRASRSFYMFAGGACHCSIACSEFTDYVWRYNVNTKMWALLHSSVVQAAVYTGTVKPGARSQGGAIFVDENSLYVFGGFGRSASDTTTGALNDMFRLNLTSLTWSWVTGTQSLNPPGSLVSLGVESTDVPNGIHSSSQAFDPATRMLYVFGGAMSYDTGLSKDAPMDTLWRFNVVTSKWTWLGGMISLWPEMATGPLKGSFGIGAPGNWPKARLRGSAAFDSANGLFYVQGGVLSWPGNFMEDVEIRNDLWRYSVESGLWAQMAAGCQSAGVFGTRGIASSDNCPPATMSGWMGLSHPTNERLFVVGGAQVMPVLSCRSALASASACSNAGITYVSVVFQKSYNDVWVHDLISIPFQPQTMLSVSSVARNLVEGDYAITVTTTGVQVRNITSPSFLVASFAYGSTITVSAATAGDDHVYVGDNTRLVQKWSFLRGERVWMATMLDTSHVISSLAVVGDALFVGSSLGRIEKRDAKTGSFVSIVAEQGSPFTRQPVVSLLADCSSDSLFAAVGDAKDVPNVIETFESLTTSRLAFFGSAATLGTWDLSASQADSVALVACPYIGVCSAASVEGQHALYVRLRAAGSVVISKTLNGLIRGMSYRINYQRVKHADAATPSSLVLNVCGTSFIHGMPTSSSAFAPGTASAFVANSETCILSMTMTSSDAGPRAIILDSVTITPTLTLYVSTFAGVPDGTFEGLATGDQESRVSPSGAWSSTTGTVGVIDSTFAGVTPLASKTYAGLLKGTADLSQTITGLVPRAAYQLRWRQARRFLDLNPIPDMFTVMACGTVVKSEIDFKNFLDLVTSTAFTADADGSCKITFSSRSSGQSQVLIDNVEIARVIAPQIQRYSLSGINAPVQSYIVPPVVTTADVITPLLNGDFESGKMGDWMCSHAWGDSGKCVPELLSTLQVTGGRGSFGVALRTIFGTTSYKLSTITGLKPLATYRLRWRQAKSPLALAPSTFTVTIKNTGGGDQTISKVVPTISELTPIISSAFTTFFSTAEVWVTMTRPADSPERTLVIDDVELEMDSFGRRFASANATITSMAASGNSLFAGLQTTGADTCTISQFNITTGTFVRNLVRPCATSPSVTALYATGDTLFAGASVNVDQWNTTAGGIVRRFGTDVAIRTIAGNGEWVLGTRTDNSMRQWAIPELAGATRTDDCRPQTTNVTDVPTIVTDVPPKPTSTNADNGSNAEEGLSPFLVSMIAIGVAGCSLLLALGVMARSMIQGHGRGKANLDPMLTPMGNIPSSPYAAGSFGTGNKAFATGSTAQLMTYSTNSLAARSAALGHAPTQRTTAPRAPTLPLSSQRAGSPVPPSPFGRQPTSNSIRANRASNNQTAVLGATLASGDYDLGSSAFMNNFGAGGGDAYDQKNGAQFGAGQDSYGAGQDSYGAGQDSYGAGQDSYGTGTDAYAGQNAYGQAQAQDAYGGQDAYTQQQPPQAQDAYGGQDAYTQQQQQGQDAYDAYGQQQPGQEAFGQQSDYDQNAYEQNQQQSGSQY